MRPPRQSGWNPDAAAGTPWEAIALRSWDEAAVRREAEQRQAELEAEREIEDELADQVRARSRSFAGGRR